MEDENLILFLVLFLEQGYSFTTQDIIMKSSAPINKVLMEGGVPQNLRLALSSHCM